MKTRTHVAILFVLTAISGLIVGCASTDGPAAGDQEAKQPTKEKVAEQEEKATDTPSDKKTDETDDEREALLTPEEEEAGGGGNRGSSGNDLLDDFARDRGVQEAEEQYMADHYYEAGRRLYEELRYQEAADELKKAVKADPDHQQARQLLDTVLYILGEREGEIRDPVRELVQLRLVKIKAAQVEMDRLFQEGKALKAQKDYLAAIERFERVLETIRWFPYNVDKGDMKAQCEALIKECRSLHKRKLEEFRREQAEMARQEAQFERYRNLKYIKARIKNLYDQALAAYKKQDFDRCENLCEQILVEDPDNQDAKSLQKAAVRGRHLFTELETIERNVEHMKRTFEAVREATIQYQDIFRFPSKDEWRRISQRNVGITERLKPRQSIEEVKINDILDRREVNINFPDVSFQEALDFLQSISGISFVLSRSARELLEGSDTSINLRLSNAKLRNVLQLVLDHEPELVYRIKNGGVLITTRDQETEELFIEFYEVSDITNQLPDYKAPKLALSPQLGDSGGGGGGGGGVGGGVLDFGGEEEETAGGVGEEKLIELIEKAIGEAVDVGSVEFSGGLLVVRKPLEAHEKIVRLLKSLRKTVGIMVTVEVRFVDVQDNFLEELGIDYRGLNAFNIANFLGPQFPNPRNQQFNLAPGYRYQDAQNQFNALAGLVNGFSNATGSSINPFNITNNGGAALQINLLEAFQVQAIIDASKKRQKMKQVDAPRITVFNGQRSHVLAINQEAYIQDVEVNQTGVIPVLNPVIGILNAGSILEARPVVSHDKKYVTLELKPTLAVNLTSAADVANLNLSANNTQIPIELPVLSVSKIRTTVTIPDGGTVMIGGLKNFRGVKNYRGVPIAGKVPFLRRLFERRGWSDLKRSLVVLVKADIRIIREEEAKQFQFQD